MKTSSYIFILIFATATATLGYQAAHHPINLPSFGFMVWALSPYGYLVVLAKWVSTKAAATAVLLTSLLAGSTGVFLIVDALFIHPDAQGGLVFLFAPVLQWGFACLVSGPIYFLNRARHA